MTEILDKISKLHQKAVSAEEIGSTAEAALFAKKVQELLHKHKLDMSQVCFENYDNEDVCEMEIKWSEYGFRDTSRNTYWTGLLAQMVARYCSCRTFGYNGSNQIKAYGRAPDLEVLDYMLQTLTPLCLQLCKRAYHEIYEETRQYDSYGRKARLKGFKDSWKLGFIKGVQEGLEQADVEAKAKAETEPNAGALVRVSSMLARVDSWITTNLRTKTSKSRASNRHGNGYEQGYKTGKQVGNRTGVEG